MPASVRPGAAPAGPRGGQRGAFSVPQSGPLRGSCGAGMAPPMGGLPQGASGDSGGDGGWGAAARSGGDTHPADSLIQQLNDPLMERRGVATKNALRVRHGTRPWQPRRVKADVSPDRLVTSPSGVFVVIWNWVRRFRLVLRSGSRSARATRVDRNRSNAGR